MFVGLLALLILFLVGPADGRRRQQQQQQQQQWREQVEEHYNAQAAGRRAAAVAAATNAAAATTSSSSGSSGSSDATSLVDALGLQKCGRIFLDGGSNTGESIRAFISGGFFTCGLHSPSRQYNKAWGELTRRERAEVMRPLKEPASFCIRSFEAAPDLIQGLAAQEADYKAKGVHDVRFFNAAITNATTPSHTRTIFKYADNYWGASAAGLKFEDVHVGGKPVPLSSRTVVGQSYDLRQIVRSAVQQNSSSVIAIKLDIEGYEYWTLSALAADTELLCSVSYLFVEFHSSASEEQRAILKNTYGLRGDDFEALKATVHAAMERPMCKLKVYWRSFWASCGDKQRFEWRTSAQATTSRPVADTTVF